MRVHCELRSLPQFTRRFKWNHLCRCSGFWFWSPHPHRCACADVSGWPTSTGVPTVKTRSKFSSLPCNVSQCRPIYTARALSVSYSLVHGKYVTICGHATVGNPGPDNHVTSAYAVSSASRSSRSKESSDTARSFSCSSSQFSCDKSLCCTHARTHAMSSITHAHVGSGQLHLRWPHSKSSRSSTSRLSMAASSAAPLEPPPPCRAAEQVFVAGSLPSG
jgi:hypothetical protein